MSKTGKRNGNSLKLLMMSSFVCFFFLVSCNSHGQEKKENEKEKTEKSHKEKKGHDKDDKKHAEDGKGHDKDGEHHAKGEHNESTETMRGEHSRDEGGQGEGEEDGTQLSIEDTYDVTKHGVRLILRYDKESNSFIGTMENTTSKKIEKARVEVHLSNGTELGPTKPITLNAKMKKELIIKATEKSFSGWSTHAEIGNTEHGGEEGEEH